MQVFSIALFSILSATSTNAIGFREFVNKFSNKSDIIESVELAPSENNAELATVPTENDAELAAFIQDLDAPVAVADEDDRRLSVAADCATRSHFFVNWGSVNWATGTCSQGTQCTFRTFTTNLACCQSNFPNQPNNVCLIAAGFVPTSAPTGVAALGTPGAGAGFFYPDYDTAWTEAGCLNTLPLPYARTGDRPTYPTMLACCRGAYGGQVSGTCLSQLPSPPTTSPTISGGILDFFYPDYATAWSVAGCSNEAPLPYPRKADRPSFSTMLACCQGSFGGQTSGACLSALPSPPTESPTANDGGGTTYYSVSTANFSGGTCTNARPVPQPWFVLFETEMACCNRFHPVAGGACRCSADACSSCLCPGNGAGCASLTCTTTP